MELSIMSNVVEPTASLLVNIILVLLTVYYWALNSECLCFCPAPIHVMNVALYQGLIALADNTSTSGYIHLYRISMATRQSLFFELELWNHNQHDRPVALMVQDQSAYIEGTTLTVIPEKKANILILPQCQSNLHMKQAQNAVMGCQWFCHVKKIPLVIQQNHELFTRSFVNSLFWFPMWVTEILWLQKKGKVKKKKKEAVTSCTANCFVSCTFSSTLFLLPLVFLLSSTYLQLTAEGTICKDFKASISSKFQQVEKRKFSLSIYHFPSLPVTTRLLQNTSKMLS